MIVLALLWFGADKLLSNLHTQNDLKQHPPTELIAGDIVLKASPDGHFRGTVSINNTVMPFMIDTGATQTVIPVELAKKAGLALGKQFLSNTAGGQVMNHATVVKSLKLGNAEIKNIDAAVNQYLHEVLIGMNTLKYFQMTQSNNTLTLTTQKTSSTHR